jgi:hypothetical protein
MKIKFVVGVLGFLASASSFAGQAETSASSAGAPAKQMAFCVLSDAPPSTAQFTVIKKIELGKGSYGKVDEAIDILVDRARNLGADAVINYSGSQRFGFWPWRFVHPVVRGTAIKWNPGNKFDCAASGSSLR